MTELATIKKQLPMLGLDDWDEIRKVEATLEAYRKYASQDRDLRDKSLQIGEATVRLKWHKGRILGEMEKSEGGRPETGSTVLPVNDTPTYAELGIDKTSAAREQLVKRAFDEERILDICAELIAKDRIPTFAYFMRLARQQTHITPEPIEGIYRVWYADPPWSYGNKGLDDYGHAERHYPTMSIVELCDMGDEIKDACEDDAVLFLWVTSPLLSLGFEVAEAWGFVYKASFIWDKVLHNFGNYNSVRHESLFICTRGNGVPDIKILHDSVISIQRRGGHSTKPERFREIIDEIYPNGNRIELFARTRSDGWDTWGDEINESTIDVS
jgi:N6-adenosine-specific RNA methylase IME4